MECPVAGGAQKEDDMIRFFAGNLFRCVCGYGQLLLLCMITSCVNSTDRQDRRAAIVLSVLFAACWAGLIVSRFVL